MSKISRKYIFDTLGLKMQKDQSKIKYFGIFEWRALKKTIFWIFSDRSTYMNFEINRLLINI